MDEVSVQNYFEGWHMKRRGFLSAIAGLLGLIGIRRDQSGSIGIREDPSGPVLTGSSGWLSPGARAARREILLGNYSEVPLYNLDDLQATCPIAISVVAPGYEGIFRILREDAQDLGWLLPKHVNRASVIESINAGRYDTTTQGSLFVECDWGTPEGGWAHAVMLSSEWLYVQEPVHSHETSAAVLRKHREGISGHWVKEPGPPNGSEFSHENVAALLREVR